MTAGIAYVDGKVMDLAEARVPLLDRGYLLGDGVFETLRTSNGHVFRQDHHEARLRKGLKAINLEGEIVDEFRDALAAMVRAATPEFGGELYLRFMVTTGPQEDVLESGRGITTTGMAKKFKPYPMQYYSHGVQVVVSKVSRKDSRSPLSRVKSLSYLPHVAARREALSLTAHDALLLNEHGRIAEASTSNVFAVVDGRVHAPGEDEGAVAGVMRGAVLEAVREADLELVERLTLEDAARATEMWLTNTTGGLVPVTRFGDAPVGTGRKGDLTMQLSHAIEAELRGSPLARHA